MPVDVGPCCASVDWRAVEPGSPSREPSPCQPSSAALSAIEPQTPANQPHSQRIGYGSEADLLQIAVLMPLKPVDALHNLAGEVVVEVLVLVSMATVFARMQTVLLVVDHRVRVAARTTLGRRCGGRRQGREHRADWHHCAEP